MAGNDTWPIAVLYRHIRNAVPDATSDHISHALKVAVRDGTLPSAKKRGQQ